MIGAGQRIRTPLLLLALSASSSAGSELPPAEYLPLHQGPVFEATVEAALPSREGDRPQQQRFRLKVSAVHRGTSTTTIEAMFNLLPPTQFGPRPTEDQLAARRQALGLVPGRRILVVAVLVDPANRRYVADSFGDPAGPRSGTESSNLDFVRGLVKEPHPAPILPDPDPVPSAGTGPTDSALGQ